MFVKTVPSHPRGRLKRKLKRQRLAKQKKSDNDDVVFMKKVPSHPRDRLKRKRKHKNDNDVLFVKKVPSHPRDRLKRQQRKDDHIVFVTKFLPILEID